jgi:hypothetical protein
MKRRTASPLALIYELEGKKEVDKPELADQG